MSLFIIVIVIITNSSYSLYIHTFSLSIYLSLSLYTYTYIYIYMYTHVHIHVHKHGNRRRGKEHVVELSCDQFGVHVVLNLPANIYIYIYMYFSLSLYIYIYIHIHIYTHVCIYTYIYTYAIYIYVYVCIYIYIYIHISIYLSLSLYIYIYIFTYVCIYCTILFILYNIMECTCRSTSLQISYCALHSNLCISVCVCVCAYLCNRWLDHSHTHVRHRLHTHMTGELTGVCKPGGVHGVTIALQLDDDNYIIFLFVHVQNTFWLDMWHTRYIHGSSYPGLCHISSHACQQAHSTSSHVGQMSLASKSKENNKHTVTNWLSN